MVIEMVTREVGKGGGFEVDACEAILRKGVAAGFDDHIFTAGHYHFLLCLGDCQTVGCCQRCPAAIIGGVINNRADKAAFSRSVLDYGADEKSNSGFSVCAGDSKVGQFRGGLATAFLGQKAGRLSRIIHINDIGAFTIARRLGNDISCTVCDGFLDKVMAVKISASYGDKTIPLSYKTRIKAKTGSIF